MTDSMMDLSCTDFADALAAKVSVPGGGGAAAYVGALGVALGSMVGNFTLGKKRYADVEEDIAACMDRAAAIQQRLIALVDEDAVAFEPLSRAYGIPKEDPTRAEVLEAATKGAIVAPLEMVRQCAQAVDVLEEMAAKGSRMLVSDAGCGALLCAAAMQCAAMNVYINTKSLADRAYAAQVEEECDQLMADVLPRATNVANSVWAVIRGR